MQRFNPERELSKIQQSKQSSMKGQAKFLILPIFAIVCCAATILSTSYSAVNLTTNKNTYNIKIEIINGEEDAYIKQVKGGYFEAKIASDATFGSINCTSGNLKYDPENQVVYSENITEDTTCIVSFMNDGNKIFSISNLDSVKDNDGDSYYFKGDTTSNYLSYKGDLYRIVRINGDGSLRLMLDNSIGSYSYGSTNKYEMSDVKKEIDLWYENKYSNDERVVRKDYDLNNYMEYDLYNLYNLTNYAYYNVGLLSLREVELINKDTETSYISSNTLLSNGYNLNEVWTSTGKISKETKAEVHPVISLKYEKLKGQGTKEMPYEIEE